MSLMSTLAKVAVGVAVAKGASAMMKGSAAGGGGLGGLLGGLAGGGAAGGSPQDMIGNLLGGAGGAGGLGGMLEQLGGAGGGGGLQDMLGGLAGGNAGAALAGLAGGGGAAAALGGLLGGAQQPPAEPQASFGAVLNSAFAQTPEEPITPSADQEAAAALMLRAMIQAAKSDGQLDDAEQEKLMGQMGGDIDPQEAEFLRAEMAKPVDAQALVADTPAGLGPQVYAMSLLAIDLDNQSEAQYLHSLAQGYGMDAAAVNDIHAQLGVTSLYT